MQENEKGKEHPPAPPYTSPEVDAASIARQYLAFAEGQAHGVSPLYEELSLHISSSPPLLAFLATLPEAKRQPNLILAAIRYLWDTPRDAAHFESLVLANRDELTSLMLRRSTQTNEPARLATLLPVFARLFGPLALLEVGSSAGLCLFPEYYGYQYRELETGAPLLTIPPNAGTPEGMESPIFPCLASRGTPLPERIPQVVWRTGLDLNPIDLKVESERRWLSALVWPASRASRGEEESEVKEFREYYQGRSERLGQAMELASQLHPPVRRGNLLTDLESLAREAPSDATLVIFHSAVLAYLRPAERERFASQVRELGATWVSNEASGVLPEVEKKLKRAMPMNRFLLALNGNPLALTGPHGQVIEWLEP